MNKECLHIFYDNGIKVQIISSKESYFLSSSWKDVLSSLFKERLNSKSSADNRFVAEYDKIVVIIDNWQLTMQDKNIGKYMLHVFSMQLQKRANEVKQFNATVNSVKKVQEKSDDDELNRQANEISELLNKRHQKVYEQQILNERKEKVSDNKLHVKRKNKYILPLLLITGGLTLFSFSHAESFNQGQYNKEDVQELISEYEPFEVGLDINDVVSYTTGDSLVDPTTKLSYSDRSNDDKVIETQIKYGSIIEECAEKCGLDPKIVLGIATQESGDHELGLRNGSCGGLMQIEVSYWKGKEITYYDFDDKEYYTIKVDKESIEEVENNILIGCAIFQQELVSLNYNIPLAIQSYNMGYTNIDKVLDATSKNTGLTKIQIINDNKCLEWLNFTSVPGQGDPNYVNNVLSWTGYGYNNYELTCKKPNGDLVVQTTPPIIVDQTKVM